MAKKINASHILVKTQAEANEIKYDLSHGVKFEDLAREKSLCSSRKKGGSLGWFSRGQMMKEFEDCAFGMSKGDISAPVKTKFGWHIIRVDDLK